MPMHAFGRVLRFLSAASLGLLVGALLAEGGVLVPFWRSLSAPEFLAWYGSNAQRLLAFFSPLTASAALLAVAAATVSVLGGQPGRRAAAIAATLAIAVVASYFVYFEQANASFARATLGAAEVPAELIRWARWHWLRAAVGVAAFAASLRALQEG